METRHPLEKAKDFIFGSLLLTLLATLFFGLFAVPTIFLTLNSDPRFTGYAFLGVVGAGIFLGQHLIHVDPTGSGSQTTLEQAIILLAYLFLYNGILFWTVVFAGTLGGNFSALLALIYPGYEFTSIKYRNPLSFSGVLIYIGIGLDRTVITLRRFIDRIDAAAPLTWLLEPQGPDRNPR